MSPLTDVTSGVSSDGNAVRLSFTAAIANVGPGPFIVHAVRGDQRGSWRVSQRFREQDAPTSEVVTPGDMVFGGHGHDHWHVQLGASYWLTRPGSSEVLRRYSKVGYCFFDQVRLRDQPADAPVASRRSQGRRATAAATLELEMGLSPGWADPYYWTLPDQRLLVTGPRRRRLPTLGGRRPERLVPRDGRDEQPHVGRHPRCTLTRPAAAGATVVARRGAGPAASG